MTLSKKTLIAGLAGAAALLFSSAAPIVADPAMGEMTQTANFELLPPEGYSLKRWQAPNGCDYSRAGRPGETVWYLIINTSGGKNCVRQIVDTVYDDDPVLSLVAKNSISFE